MNYNICIYVHKLYLNSDLQSSLLAIIWRAWCRNGLSDDFGPPFTKPRNYLSSCNATLAKGLVLCRQHIILAIQKEFLPKEHQFSLLLTRKEKLPKCQEILIISARGKNTYFCSYPWWMGLKEKKGKKSQTRLAVVDYPDRNGVLEAFSTPKWQILFYL